MGKVKFFFTFGAIFIIAMIGSYLSLRDLRGTKHAVDFNEMNYQDLEDGMYVKGTTDMVVDYYCEQKTTKKGVTTTARWYLIPYSNDTESYRFVAVKVFDKMIPDYEKVADDTEAYNAGKVPKLSYEIKVNGEVKACEGEIKKYLNEYIAEVEKETGESWEGVFAPFYIQMVQTGTTKIVLGICIGMMVISVLAMVIFAIKARSEKVDYSNYYSANTYSSSPYDQPIQPRDELDKILADEDAKMRKDDDPFNN